MGCTKTYRCGWPQNIGGQHRGCKGPSTDNNITNLNDLYNLFWVSLSCHDFGCSDARCWCAGLALSSFEFRVCNVTNSTISFPRAANSSCVPHCVPPCLTLAEFAPRRAQKGPSSPLLWPTSAQVVTMRSSCRRGRMHPWPTLTAPQNCSSCNASQGSMDEPGTLGEPTLGSMGAVSSSSESVHCGSSCM